MKDPLIHAPQDPIIFGLLPAKTVRTGCGKRRDPDRVSDSPYTVNCQPCREASARHYETMADMALAAADLPNPFAGTDMAETERRGACPGTVGCVPSAVRSRAGFGAT